jgi:hypothetical protein
MKKHLLTILTGLGCAVAINASAQVEPMIKHSISRPANAPSALRTSTATCGTDTIVYPYLKELVFAAPDDSFFVDAMVGNVRTATQAYHITGSANVVGVQFWGGAYTTSATFQQSLPVKVMLYNVNAQNQPTTAIDSAIVNVSSGYNYYDVNFTTPHAVTSNFAVGVKSSINDTLAVITNNAGNTWSPNYGEGLAWRRFGSGTWNSALSFFGQDLEYMIWPIVNYNITSNYTMANDSTCTGTANTFNNTSSSILSDRMFNLYAFDEYWGLAAADSSYEWNYGDSQTWTNSVNGSHTYTTAGTYNVKLASEMLGYYTTCHDTMTMSLTVMPQVASGFTYDATMEPMISFMESATGEMSYLWDFGDGNTSSLPNPTHTYANTGNYTVTLTVSGFCGTNMTTQVVNITTTGIQDATGNFDVNAFYNSDASLLNVTLPASSNATVEVYNIVGKLIYTESAINAASKSISLNGLSAGTYVVRVKTANGIGAAKFAVIK